MNIKQLAQRYKEELPKTDTELEFIRAVCIKIGKEHSFDARYYLGNSQTRRDIYKMAKRTAEDVGIIVGKRTIICVSLSYKMQQLFNEFGYKVEVIPDEGDHVYPIIYLNDGRILKIDVQLDLENIQSGCRTKYFGTRDFEDVGFISKIDEKELERIDKKIGYISEQYRDERFDEIFQEVRNLPFMQKVKRVLENPEIYEPASKMDFVESNKYYRQIERRFFGYKEYMNRFFTIMCYKQNENKEKQYTNCIYIKPINDEEPLIYIFSNKSNKYEPISTGKIHELQMQGLNIGVGPHERGLKLLQKEISKSQEYQEQRR